MTVNKWVPASSQSRSRSLLNFSLNGKLFLFLYWLSESLLASSDQCSLHRRPHKVPGPVSVRCGPQLAGQPHWAALPELPEDEDVHLVWRDPDEPGHRLELLQCKVLRELPWRLVRFCSLVRLFGPEKNVIFYYFSVPQSNLSGWPNYHSLSPILIEIDREREGIWLRGLFGLFTSDYILAINNDW